MTEILVAARWPVRELYLAMELPELERAETYALGMESGAVVSVVACERIRALCGATDHQGYLARMGPFPYVLLEDVVKDRDASPLFILLDAVRDAHNFGAIVRSAAALGAAAVIAGGEGQAPVNNHTVRASAGAVNRIPVALESSLPSALNLLKEHQVRCIATMPGAAKAVWEYDFHASTAIVLGNEARGVSPDVLALCEDAVNVPLVHSVESLNVSAAAAIVLYEASRQRNS